MDLNTALMESITSMSEYFVAANTRTSFTDMAESAGGGVGSTNNLNSINNLSPSTSNSPGATHKHQLGQSSSSNLLLSTNSTLQHNNHHRATTNSNNNHNLDLHDNLEINDNNNLPAHHSSASSCNQNNYHRHNSNNNGNNRHHHDHSTSSYMQSSPRFSQPIRTQIPIHCYIEQMDSGTDTFSYQSPLNDNDLFSTRNPMTTGSSQTNDNNNDHHHNSSHLHQSKLALESVTNCNGTSSTSNNLANDCLFDDNDPLDSTDLDAIDPDIDQLQADSPLSIHPTHFSSSLPSSNNNTNDNTPQTSSSICGDQLDYRQSSASFYDTGSNFHACKETYVIISSNVLYIDLVRTVLLQLGYTIADLINAKATIQIKNWKPLALDQVTEDKGATVGEVLGDISTYATLRIRLYSSASSAPTEWTETMIRQIVLALTQTMSQLTLSKLCNISQPLISSIVRGGKKLGRRKCAEFGQWYLNYIKLQDARPSALSNQPAGGIAAAGCMSGGGGLGGGTSSGGARLVFDKTREIPKLKSWFANNTKPSEEVLEEYTRILNEDTLRKDRPQVTAKALKNWWKNERQKLGIRQREIRGRPKLKQFD